VLSCCLVITTRLEEFLRFEEFMAVNALISSFWIIEQFNLVVGYLHQRLPNIFILRLPAIWMTRNVT
jgi:hypothetical protein